MALFPDLYTCLGDYSGEINFGNSRSKSAFFEFLLQVGDCCVVPALGEKNCGDKRPRAGVHSPEQGSGGWSEGRQHTKQEVK